jgi:hypothetical protein
MDKSIDDTSTGVFYHTRLFRGKYVYMVHTRSAVLQEVVANTLGGHKIPMVAPKLYKAAKEMADINNGLKAYKDDMATISGAKLSSNDPRSLARRYWNTHKDILCEIADGEVVEEHSITDWATATPEQKEQRQQNRTDAKAKCVLEQSTLLKASRNVVAYVGNTEMPKWSDDNKESVESHAIELRHKLAQARLGHRVQHPTTAEHVRYEAPPPAKDPEAEKLVCPEETLTPDERASNVREVDVTAGLFAEIDNISKKGVTSRALRWTWRWKTWTRRRKRSQWR